MGASAKTPRGGGGGGIYPPPPVSRSKGLFKLKVSTGFPGRSLNLTTPSWTLNNNSHCDFVLTFVTLRLATHARLLLSLIPHALRIPQVWDIAESKQVCTLYEAAGARESITALSFAHDSETLLSATNNPKRAIVCWGVHKPKGEEKLQGFQTNSSIVAQAEWFNPSLVLAAGTFAPQATQGPT